MDLIAHDGAKNNKSPLAYIVVTSEWYHGLWTPGKAFSNVFQMFWPIVEVGQISCEFFVVV